MILIIILPFIYKQSYNRFRYYSPDEGMYISQDPIRLNGGFTLYSYVHDPNGWVDVLGLEGCPTDDDDEKYDYVAKDYDDLLNQMKSEPPKHPDYQPPKKWDGKKKNGGWPDKKGRSWEPDDHKRTHAPHWDVQDKTGGGYETVYPNAKVENKNR